MTKIAMIGVGAISGIYLKNITEVFKEIELVGMCDLIHGREERGLAYIKEQQAKGIDCKTPKIYKDMLIIAMILSDVYLANSLR